MRLKIYLLIIISLLSLTVLAQEADFTTTISKNKMGINERIRVTYGINKQGADNFMPPKYRNFKIVGGPSQSISQSFVNGKRSFNQTYSYVIQPTKKGELMVPGASIEIDGVKLKSTPVVVLVTDPIVVPLDPNDPNYIASQSIHLVAEISNKNPYVGEGVYVEYRLYIKNNINVYDAGVTEAPKQDGFWSQDIKINGVNPKKGKYNGEEYTYFPFQKTLLIPTKSGKISLGTMKMEVAIGVPSGQGDFFGNPISKKLTKEFISTKKTINVKELPLEGMPENFVGAVGDFRFSIATDKKVLKANESSQIKVTVNGKGNLKLFELPKIVVPKELEVYTPERKERVRILSSGISGSISDLYTVVPQYKGKYKIPNITFSYFNPTTKQFKTITTEDVIVTVLEGKELRTASSNTAQKQIVKNTGKNFRYIQTKTSFIEGKQEDFFRSNAYYSLLIFFFMCIPIGLLIAKKTAERNNDLIGNKLRRAERLAKKYLAEASKNLGKKEAFYESLERALHNYLKAKLGIETAEISRERITEILRDKNIKEIEINEFLAVLKDCDFARYAPSTDLEMEGEYEKAKEIIIALDKQF